ncbi:true [Symbiodinium sp. CCMP2592]|nr:true [Symbiodinium sp. CCMP2592]
MDYEEVLRQFQTAKAEQGEDEDVLLSALLQKHQQSGRWKQIVAAFASLSETKRSKEWLQRRGRRLKLRDEAREEVKAEKTGSAPEEEHVAEGREVPDMFFREKFHMLKKAVMGCQTDSHAQGFLKNSRDVQMEMCSICHSVEYKPPVQGQIDAVLFQHYCASLSKTYNFRKSRHWTTGFCCESQHCKTRFIVMKSLDALGSPGDGELVFLTLRNALREFFTEKASNARRKAAIRAKYSDILPLCFDQFCPFADCMYTKPLAALRKLVFDHLETQRGLLSRALQHPAAMWSAVAAHLSAPLQAQNVNCLLGKKGTALEQGLRDAYVEWLLDSILPTLGIVDAGRMSEWHIIPEWQRILMTCTTASNLGIPTEDLQKMTYEDFSECLKGFLDIELAFLTHLPGVDVDRWLLRLLLWSSFLTKYLLLVDTLSVELTSAEDIKLQERMPEPVEDVPALELARLPVGTWVRSTEDKSGMRGELIAAKGSTCLVKFPNRYHLEEIASQALFPVGTVGKCQGCKKLGVWSCSGCCSALYCSTECQHLHWANHCAMCAPAEDAPDALASEAVPPHVDLRSLVDQLNFALQILEASKRDEAPCGDVWKAIALLEHVMEVLEPVAYEPLRLAKVEDEENVYFVNGSLRYLLVKVLVSAAQMTGHAGDDKRAVSYADQAISLLADLRQQYASHRLGMEDHVVLQAKAHFARSLSLPSSPEKRQSLHTATQLCEYYGLPRSECIYFPDSHKKKLGWDWVAKLGSDSGTCSDESVSGNDSDSNVHDPPPAPPLAILDCASCTKCGDRVKKSRLKIHWQRECPSRRATCPHCSEWCEAAFMEEHQAKDCTEYPVSCELCHTSVARRLMGHHLRSDCCFRMVSCSNSGCTWQDVAENASIHQERCPFGQQTCEFCMESFQSRFMPSHVCPIVLMDQTCTACCEPFADLAKQDILPAIFLRSGSRACRHASLCVRCATKWSLRAESRSLLPQCPLCRVEFDTWAACPPDLLVEVAQPPTATSRPFPRMCDCPADSYHWLSPLRVHFTHASISEHFKKEESSFGWRKPRILDTVQQLLQGVEPEELDCLEVVWHQGRVYVAGSGNRRLCVWRLLCLFYPQQWAAVKVKFKNRGDPRIHFKAAFDTTCSGDFVQVRRGRFVGKTLEPCGDDPGVVWTEAWDLLKPTPRRLGR